MIYKQEDLMSYALEALTPCDDEFFDVIKLCGFPYNENDAVPLIIEKIVNPALTEAFQRRVDSITKKLGEPPKLRWPMYHGTTLEAAHKIAAGGFDASKSRVAAYNKGTYFAQDYTYSRDGYARQDSSGYQFMFVCKVIEGRMCTAVRDGGITDTSKFESAGSYDGSILSSPFDDGALPVYFVRYYKRIPGPQH